MLKMVRELERAFPDHTIVRLKNNHFGIYDEAGCCVCVASATPSDIRTWANVRQQVKRHVCPAMVPAI